MLPPAHFRRLPLVLLATIALLAGCTTSSTPHQTPVASESRAPAATTRGPATRHDNDTMPSAARSGGIDLKELAALTNKMAQSISGIGDLAMTPSAAYIVVVVEPIRNETTFPIDEEWLTDRVRTGLNHSGGGHLQFVTHDHMLAIEHDQQSKPPENVDPLLGATHGIDYQLVGSIGRRPGGSSKRANGYVSYTFRLINLHTSEVVWEDTAELKTQDLDAPARR